MKVLALEPRFCHHILQKCMKWSSWDSIFKVNLEGARDAVVALKAEVLAADERVVDGNGKLKKQEYLFAHTKNMEWLAKLEQTINDFEALLSSVNKCISVWGGFFNPHMSQSAEARKFKENKAKAVCQKMRLHKQHQQEVLSKLAPEWKDNGPVPVPIYGFLGLKACVWVIWGRWLKRAY